MKRLAVLTSGGDAPGMNAAIRAVGRMAIHLNYEIIAALGGYQGILNGDFLNLEMGSMANIIQRGGTFIKTGRCSAFMTPEGRQKAAENLKRAQIDALIVIGGDGSFRGAHALWEETKFPVVGVPGTIDNDIFGTDNTIGFDTAVNIALEAIDRIRDTAASHDRLFIVEVMGRNSGFIAIDVGLGGGAEEIFFPDNPVTVNEAIEHIRRGMSRGKKSSILVTAEGQKPGRAYDLAEAIRKKAGFDAKVAILGHVQRGGPPTAIDRILASRLGAAAVECLKYGASDVMIGLQKDEVVQVPLDTAINQKKHVSRELIRLGHILSS